MTWQHPFVLALVPLALAAAWWLFRRDAGRAELARFPNIAQRWSDRHGLTATPAHTRGRVRGVALALAAGLAALALARPQWGEIAEPRYQRGREVMLGLDLSRSMLAGDVSPSRLARAKLLVDALLDQLQGERVGLTVFAGTAFVQSPLSADYEVLRDLLAALEPSYLPQGGTDYAAMLTAATEAFGAQGDGDRYLVVLSDGEAHDAAWQAALPALQARHIKVIGLGIGTPQGALLSDESGAVITDAHGNAVLSKLEPATLQELASATGGTYRDAAAWVDIAELVGATVAQGQPGEYVEQQHVRRAERFQWFLAPALLFFLLSYWREFPVFPLSRARAARGRRPQRGSAPAVAAALAALIAWHTPGQAQAVAADRPPPRSVAAAPQPADLAATIDELSSKPSLAPADYARLASDTIGYAAQPSAPQGAARSGVIDDGLAAVARGEQADAHAADWPALRQQLEALRTAPQPPPSQQQENKPDEASDRNTGVPPADSQPTSNTGVPPANSQPTSSAGVPPADSQPTSGAGVPPANSQPAEGEQPHQGSASAAKDAQADQADSRSAQSGDENSPGSDAQNAEAQRPQPPPSQQQETKPDEASERSAGVPPANSQPAEGEQPHQDGASAAKDAQADQADSRSAQSGDENSLGSDARNAEAQRPPAGRPAGEDARRQQDRAGLGDAEDGQDEPAQAPTRQVPIRMVGGGRAQADDTDSEAQGDVAMADALGRMRAVKQGDAPAVLFDRMNRAEGRPQRAENGQDW
jgi:Ca-activated chloride channel family protein